MAAPTIRTSGQHFVQPDGDESHIPVEVPSAVHWTRLPPLNTVGQSGVSHALPVQDRSHLHAELQFTRSHALLPEHVTVQRESLAQSTLRQAFDPTQLIVQLQPGGQRMFPQLLVLEHSTRHVRATSSHDVQSGGQLGTTQ